MSEKFNDTEEKKLMNLLDHLGYDAIKCDDTKHGTINFNHPDISEKTIDHERVKRAIEMTNFIENLRTFFIKRGLPDFFVIPRHTNKGFFIELKSETNNLSDEQKESIKTLVDDFNFSVYLVRYKKHERGNLELCRVKR